MGDTNPYQLVAHAEGLTIADLAEALEDFRIKRICTCGYGGQHEPENKRCEAHRAYRR